MIKKLEKTLLVLIGLFLGVLLTTTFLILVNQKGTITGLVISEREVSWISDEDLELKNTELIIKKENLSIISLIEGRSMEPVIANSILITSNIKYKSPEIGDIILYREEGFLVAHRILSKGIDNSGIYYITKGDNNILSDHKIRAEKIEGIVVGILY